MAKAVPFQSKPGSFTAETQEFQNKISARSRPKLGDEFTADEEAPFPRRFIRCRLIES
jgi:hypothetical protein